MNPTCRRKTILCVEDDRKILHNNSIMLKDRGYEVLAAENLMQAKEHLAKETPDAIILDIMLPDGTGLEFLCELRRAGNNIPVLLLTARDKSSDVALGLHMGANDYLSKPFEYDELFARIETMFRNVGQMPERITYKELTFDIPSGQVLFRGKDLVLNPKEYALLLFFTQNERKIMNADELYIKVWNAPLVRGKSTLQSVISRLRKKIEHTGCDIHIIRNKGYYFE